MHKEQLVAQQHQFEKGIQAQNELHKQAIQRD
jgi:hypothetical protein